MPYEIGGRADKQGNLYEKRCIANLILRLIREEIASICVENVGDDETGIDCVVTNLGGSKEFYQYKGRNGASEYWNVSDLNRVKVLVHSRKHLEGNPDAKYYFVSAVSFKNLDDLCRRARNADSVESFIQYQTKTNREIEKIFLTYAKYAQLNMDVDSDRCRIVDLLSRSNFCQVADDALRREHLLSDLSFLFVGDSESILTLVENYAVDQDRLGCNISAIEMTSFMEQRGYMLRQLDRDTRIGPRVSELNIKFSESYSPILGELFHRKESDQAINHLQAGHSLLLLGSAGTGKSGCLHEIISNLKKEMIPYLGIRLDRAIQANTAEQYGQALGLPASPVRCLHAISANNPCVIVLDQLDALRWTAAHSSSALEVCKELIREADGLNQSRNGKISIVLVCRTFDYENDRGLRCFGKNDDKYRSLCWQTISIGPMDEDDVSSIIGIDYRCISPKLQAMLRIPSYLYVWILLSDNNRKRHVNDAYGLMQAWWDQIKNEGVTRGILTQQIEACKETIVDFMASTSRLYVPKHLITDSQSVDILASCNLLSGDDNKISFNHQSYFDFFLVQRSIIDIYQGDHITSQIDPYELQTPYKRYRLQMLLQQLQKIDPSIFLSSAKELMISTQIHFYFKCVVFEIIGQFEDDEITTDILNFLHEYWIIEGWREKIYASVFARHPQFAKYMVDREFCSGWLQAEAYNCLWLINSVAPDFLYQCVAPLAFENEETAKKVFELLPIDASADSDALFDLRLQLLKKYNELHKSMHIYDLYKKSPDRFISVLCCAIEHSFPLDKIGFSYGHSEEKFSQFIEQNAGDIIHRLLPVIIEATQDITYKYDTSAYSWMGNPSDYFDQPRGLVLIVKRAFSVYINENLCEAKRIIEAHYKTAALIEHEIVSAVIASLPLSESNFAISWLLHDFSKNIFCKTDCEVESITYGKQIISKFSGWCDENLFQTLENSIIDFHEEDEKSRAEWRFNYKADNNCLYFAFWPYWGNLQKALLPLLDKSRISEKIKRLIGVLDRNFELTGSSAYDTHNGLSGCVTSVIAKVADKLSDKNWRKIILNDFTPKPWSRKYSAGTFFDASPESFSQSLSSVAGKDPLRFSQLALTFSPTIRQCYRLAFLRCLEKPISDVEHNSKKYVDLQTTVSVVKKFYSNTDYYYVTGCLSLFQARAQEEWPEEIHELICDIALGKITPQRVSSMISNEEPSLSALMNQAVDCIGGQAAYTIASLIWENNELFQRYRLAIDHLVQDQCPAVRFAAMECVVASFNINKEQAKGWFLSAFLSDSRVLGARQAWHLLSAIYDQNKVICTKGVTDLFYSKFEGFTEVAAGMACARYLFYSDLEDLVFHPNQTPEQINGITHQAIYCFNNGEYRDKCKEVLMSYTQPDEIKKINLLSLFHGKQLRISQDKEFLLHLCNYSDILGRADLLDFLVDSDEDIESFVDILFSICEHMNDADYKPAYYFKVESILLCIFRLFDRNLDNEIICIKCLDMFDMIYKSHATQVEQLSRQLEELA